MSPYVKPVAKVVFFLVVFVVLIVLAVDQHRDCAAAGGGHLEKTGRNTTHCVNDHGEEVKSHG